MPVLNNTQIALRIDVDKDIDCLQLLARMLHAWMPMTPANAPLVAEPLPVYINPLDGGFSPLVIQWEWTPEMWGFLDLQPTAAIANRYFPSFNRQATVLTGNLLVPKCWTNRINRWGVQTYLTMLPGTVENTLRQGESVVAPNYVVVTTGRVTRAIIDVRGGFQGQVIKQFSDAFRIGSGSA